jgi:tripartite-type tricarboxylate transporter receptor subunit TctC
MDGDNMKTLTRRTMLALMGSAAAAPLMQARGQQSWPSHPLTMIVGYPPGGGADLMARIVSPIMSETLGQSVIIENKAGSAAQIAAAAVARSAPDGYNFLVDASAFAINLALYPTLPYTRQSFETVGVIARVPLVLVVNPKFPAHSVAELIEVVKSKPQGVFYASSGAGSLMHVAATMFMAATHTSMVHVPYRGAGQAITDVISGQVPVYFCNGAAALPHIKSGNLRALAVTSQSRSPELPEIPTVAETGVQGVEVTEWNGMYVPAGTPAAIVDRLYGALHKALQAPDVRQKLAQVAAEPFTGSRAEAVGFVNDEIDRFAKVIKQFDIKVE